jgi:hypothetical protein
MGTSRKDKKKKGDIEKLNNKNQRKYPKEVLIENIKLKIEEPEIDYKKVFLEKQQELLQKEKEYQNIILQNREKIKSLELEKEEFQKKNEHLNSLLLEKNKTNENMETIIIENIQEYKNIKTLKKTGKFIF